VGFFIANPDQYGTDLTPSTYLHKGSIAIPVMCSVKRGGGVLPVVHSGHMKSSVLQ
jgi:hypothetical protein